MSTNNKSNAAVEGFKVTVTRVVQAPCDVVFRAWTDPAQLSQWFGPAEIQCRGFTGDMRVGGAYRVHMVSPKGDHIAFGEYRQITPNKRLQFSWQWEKYAMPDSLVTVDFEDLGHATRLTLVHEGLPDQEDRDEHNHGWNSLIEKFALLMEQAKIKQT
jgi:uncharacterized protein YndB with AHSA1/START domain